MTKKLETHESYEGKQGRHPQDCDCTTCSKRRGEAPKTPESTTEAPKTPESTPEAPKTPESTIGAPKAPEPTDISTIAKEGEVQDNANPVQSKTGLIQKEEKIDKKGKKQVSVKLPAKLFKFVGDKLANITKMESYRLTDSEAQDIADLVSESAEAHGIKVSGDWGLAIVFIIWLGIPTLELAYKNRDKLGGLAFWKKKPDEKPQNPQIPTA